MNELREQKKHDRQTEAYKAFLAVAKKVQYLEYGKWELLPDPSEPLRKFILQKDIGWATLKLKVFMEETYHRNDYSENRYDWKAIVVTTGLYSRKDKELHFDTNMRVKPRMAQKLVKYVNETVVPKFYKDIESERLSYETQLADRQNLLAEISKVKGLKFDKGVFNEGFFSLENCPLHIEPSSNNKEILLKGTISYDEFAEIASKMGWGI